MDQPSGRNPSHVAIALPTVGSDYEGTRALLQERIGLWAFWVFILSFGFYVANLATWPFTMPLSVAEMLFAPGPMFHLAASLLFGAVAVLARRAHFSYRALRALDAGTLIGGCALFSFMGMYLAQMELELNSDPSLGVYAGLLASANVVGGRAIFVPSTATRTFWLRTLAMISLVPDTYLATRSAASVVNIACWCAVSIAIATVGSRVIFGLRTEAARVRRLGQYTLEEKIGAGGMGVVYRASHAMLRRPTAIKLLPPDRAGESNLQRF